MNLYSVGNGDYYTAVMVIAENDEEAIELAREVFLKDGRRVDYLIADLDIENIELNKTSDVIVW